MVEVELWDSRREMGGAYAGSLVQGSFFRHLVSSAGQMES